MKAEKSKKYICCLIAAVMLLSGICTERVPADSSFLCAEKGNNLSVLNIFRTLLKNQEACAEERLDVLESERRMELEECEEYRYGGRTGTAAIDDFWAGNCLMRLRFADYGRKRSNSSRDVIVKYIHCQDGEKNSASQFSFGEEAGALAAFSAANMKKL